MDEGEEYDVDFRLGRTDLADMLGTWVQAGFTPDPPTPKAVMTTDGRALHRYHMVYAGQAGWNNGPPENGFHWAE